MKNICVYCGSSLSNSSKINEAAEELGKTLAMAKLNLIYGGANVGLMGLLADGALSENGRVIGVLPRELESFEIAHDGLSELHYAESMHERKSLMEQKSDAFVALPGGAGTFEEFFEQLTWNQIGIHSKPVYLLNIDGYYDLLIEFMHKSLESGLIRPVVMERFHIFKDVGSLIQTLKGD
ncbi:MAG: TIGR00730 family Rossman fold protein [Lentisphaeraceae bacterium]|nr:TIGR00730 family Rossman fold protein [Lentisphaeraceae bacterium]